MKAWRVSLWGIQHIYHAETRGKAKYRCKVAAQNVGYYVNGDWVYIRATRSPENDNANL